MSRRNKRGRSSLITIFLVIILITIAAILTINILNKNTEAEEEEKEYISHLDEEDFMVYEYSNIDSTLSGLYAFAIKDGFVVGVCDSAVVNICSIDVQKEYDYSYSKGKLYLLDKEAGQISVISLKQLGEIVDTINIGERVESFQVVDDGTIYFIASNSLKQMNENNILNLYDNITCNNFVVKNGEIFIVRDRELIKIKEEQEEAISKDVENIEYYKYYERDRLLYDTSSDNINVFKNIYNYYTKESVNSIKNNTYFIPYDEFKYVYVTNDRKSIVRINDSGSNEYIYKTENDDLIEDIVFYKNRYVEFKIGDEILKLRLDTKVTTVSDNITCLNNIKFIK